MPHNSRGFTLVEIIVGLVVLAIAFTVISTLFVAHNNNTVDPVHRARAATLAQGLLNEVLSRSYDQQSDHNGSQWRCGEPSQAACTLVVNFGPDAGEARATFNDVDDFITSDFVDAVAYADALGLPLAAQYKNFQLRIQVSPYGGVADQAKLVQVSIKTPLNEELDFALIRGNY